MNTTLTVFVILLLTTVNAAKVCKKSITRASGPHAPLKKEFCSGQLIFQDRFDRLDFTKWQHENTLGGGGNWEFQWYTNNRTNSYTEKGALKIKPSLTSDHFGEAALSSATITLNGGTPADECTNPLYFGCERMGTPTNILNPIKSARLRTVHSFSFRYGRVQIRAKLPTGDWLWPAISLFPRYNQYGMWPASGEINLLQSRGNTNFTVNDINIGVEQVTSSLRWGPDYRTNEFSLTRTEKNNATGYNSDFHIYELIWTNTHMTFKIDDSAILVVKPPKGGFWELGQFNPSKYANPWISGTRMAPFDEEFYIVMGLAAGGVNGYFPDDPSTAGAKPWSNKSPKAALDFWNGKTSWLPSWKLGTDEPAFIIDYIRVFAL